MRARHLQQWLELVAAWEQPYAARFAEALNPVTRAQIIQASPVQWLPAVLNTELAEVTLAAFGSRRAHDYYRRAFVASMQGPLLGPLVRVGKELFGLSPAAFVRWANKGWNLSYRDAGSLDGEVLGEGRAHLVFRDVPEQWAASQAWIDSSFSHTYGLFDVTGTTGVVRFLEKDRAARRFVLELEWS
jgi:hypothetical protein